MNIDTPTIKIDNEAKGYSFDLDLCEAMMTLDDIQGEVKIVSKDHIAKFQEWIKQKYGQEITFGETWSLLKQCVPAFENFKKKLDEEQPYLTGTDSTPVS